MQKASSNVLANMYHLSISFALLVYLCEYYMYGCLFACFS